MAVRDPYFWHRFSVAVHLENETKQPEFMTAWPSPSPTPYSTSSSTSSEALKQPPDWLTRQHRKRRFVHRICWALTLLFFLTVGGVIGLLVWLRGR
ncbi:MAG: hypothetical protein M1833_006446 [Piccolia ochrophora]|nr:MAG: hypothetical protein M1833_006446 [Piccolia ochrophora]